MSEFAEGDGKLDRTLGPLMLWGLGVGYVISGMYFGWSLGLPEGGTLGLAIATFFIIIMYVCFTFSYTELACAIPKAGGAFDYSKRAFGNQWGFLGGMAQNIEFIFAPPAIAFAIGAYLNIHMPSIPANYIAIAAFIIFTGVNIIGVRIAAMFELVITIIAVVELLIFAGVALPHFETANLAKNAFPNGWEGVFRAIPFAIWFFLAIEGVANVAEETINPQRNVLIGFGSAIATLVILCLLTFTSAIGVGGWETIVYEAGSTAASDSPLPLAIKSIAGGSDFLYHLIVWVGLFGLVASFHGIILAAGRATFEFGRVGFAPKIFGKTHKKFKTPAFALLINMIIGIGAVLTNRTGDIITLACFGALSLYVISMCAFFKLRVTEPDLERPFKVFAYPLVPALALLIATVSLIAMSYYNQGLALLFFGIMLGSSLIFTCFYKEEK